SKELTAQPPSVNPPVGSSSGPPGACMTPSSDMNVLTTSFLTRWNVRRMALGGGAAEEDERPAEQAEGGDRGGDADEVPGGPAGFVESLADVCDVDAAGIAGGFDGVVERDVDGHRDHDGDQVEDERGDDPGECGSAPVTHRGGAREDERTEERGAHEPGIDDRAVDRLEGTDERPVVCLVQAGHDRVGVEREDA